MAWNLGLMGAASGIAPNNQWAVSLLNSTSTVISARIALGADSSNNSYFLSLQNPTNTQYIWKYDALGTLVFQRKITVPNDSVLQYGVVDSSGNVYLSGYSYPPSGFGRHLTVVISSTGTITWQRELAYSGSYYTSRGIDRDSSGNIYSTGEFQFGGAVHKYNSSGTLQWAKSLDGGNFESLGRMSLDSSANIYSNGYVYVASPAGSTGLVAKHDTSGNLGFQKRVSQTGIEIYGDSVEVLGGAVYVASDAGSGNKWIAKFDTSGNVSWQKTVNTQGAASGWTTDSAGAIYYYTYENNANFYLIKFDSSGNVTWQRRFNAGANNGLFVGDVTWANNYIYFGVGLSISYLDTGAFTGIINVPGNTITVSVSSLTIANASYTIGNHSLTSANFSTSSFTPTGTSTSAGDLTATTTYY